ncbi:BTB/POZ domain-containing protein 6-like [Paramacrobiotus metropolitanus]|uniref:BTB/POZ domain-containing protein 6-like n=1 Tax=Paramacrobiotus metropolitanus TaxID=2943436 RepID=UPI002446383E|nr:BTB/POZ domain-containing protein 6-like [Paramacrobiotus metropolitanus]
MSQTLSPPNGTEVFSPPRRGALDLIADRMGRMLESGDLSDVQFEVGRQFGRTKIFRAHRYVLSSSSDVFYTMFYGSLPEKCSTPIDIPDVPEDAFEIMLKYIYTDKVDVDGDNVYPTMLCADKYDLPRLTDHCFGYILTELSTDTCLHHLEKALLWGAPAAHIVENCLHFVDVHCQEVLGSKDFTEIKNSTLRRIVERDTLFVEENIICTAVNNWAVAACARSNLEPSPTNRLQVMREVFRLIRFPLMTDKQLADGPAGSGLLTPSALMEIYLHKHATMQHPVPSGLFPTQPRQAPVIHVGGMEFKHEEEIFMEEGSHWYPAEVLGAHGSAVVGFSRRLDKMVMREPEKLIRVSDILTRGQKVLLCATGHWGPCTEGTYVEPGVDGWHEIDAAGQERMMQLPEIILSNSQVDAWKMVKASSSKGNLSGRSQRKRSQNAANIV